MSDKKDELFGSAGAAAATETPEPVEGEVVNGNGERRTAIVKRPADISDGLALLPVEEQKAVLVEYDARRNNFREWLLSHMTEGVHYGIPPGCEPRGNPDPRQWQSKPSLYKAGALLLIDLLKIQPRFTADKDAWEQLGGIKGSFVMKCELLHPKTGTVVGEGRGIFAVNEKKMVANSAIKMAEKRALVDAVINTVAVCADLFTQDTEDNVPPPKPAAAADPMAPDAPTRAERSAPPTDKVTGAQIAVILNNYCAAVAKTAGNMSKEQYHAQFKAFVNRVASGSVETVADWSLDLAENVKAAIRDGKDLMVKEGAK